DLYPGQRALRLRGAGTGHLGDDDLGAGHGRPGPAPPARPGAGLTERAKPDAPYGRPVASVGTPPWTTTSRGNGCRSRRRTGPRSGAGRAAPGRPQPAGRATAA